MTARVVDATSVQLDLEDAAAARSAVAALPTLDVLVNNAATNPHFGPMLTIDERAWDKTFEVNVKGYFGMIQLVAGHLQERKAKGSIVNVASVVGLMAAPMQGVYAMTKSAVVSMTKTLAMELGAAGIRVNAIAPGLVETKFAQVLVDNGDTVVLGGIFEQLKRQSEEKVPFFGNLPWVGFLFRTNDIRDERRELLIDALRHRLDQFEQRLNENPKAARLLAAARDSVAGYCGAEFEVAVR